MDAKHIIQIHKCTLRKSELTKLLVDYEIPANYKIILPIRNQCLFYAPEGFVALYTHYQSNLRILIPKFFCEVLNYYE